MYADIINLTSADVALKTNDGYTVFPAPAKGPNGEPMHARVEYSQGPLVYTDEGVAIRLKGEDTVLNLPEVGYRDHKCDVKTLYIVDHRVAEACPDRTDLVCLGTRAPNYYAHTVGRYDDIYAPRG